MNRMSAELKDAKITHVSYVDKGANKKTFFFTKSEDGKSDPEPTFKKEIKVYTKSEELQLVYGVVYEPDVEDAHGDFMTANEIEKAAHGFLKDARNVDTQHDFEAGVGEVVESYVAPSDLTIGEQEITKGSWVLVTKASEEIWEKIKKGDITGYSMAGTAVSVEKEEAPSTDNSEKGLFNLLKNFFAGDAIQKGKLRDKYNNNLKRCSVWAAFDGLESEFYDSLWDNETPNVADFERLKEAAKDFVEILDEIQTEGDVIKALEDKGEANVKKEEIVKAFKEAVEPLEKKIEAMEKAQEQEGEAPDNESEDDSDDIVKAIQEVLAPFEKRLDKIEKLRGISKQESEEDSGETNVKKSVWDGLI